MKMRAWILTAAIAVPAAALAPTQKTQAESPAQQPSAQQPPATPAQPGAADQAAQQQAAQQQAEQEKQAAEQVKQLVQKLREKGDNYTLKGTIAQVAPDGSALLVKREELPGVLLILPPNVAVTEGGKGVGVQQLQPGDQIRATFNIAQQYPIALDIVRTGHEAKPPAATPQPQK